MKNSIIITLVAMVLLSGGCRMASPAARGHADASYGEVAALLARQAKVPEVLKRFGKPLNGFDPSLSRENLLYYLPNGRILMFSYLGDYVFRAEFAGREIKGIEPKTYKMEVRDEMKFLGSNQAGNRSYSHSPVFRLDGEVFRSYEEFQKRLEDLPPRAIVQWRGNGMLIDGEIDPLSTKEDQDSFSEFCRKTGIFLEIQPGR